MNVLRQGRGRSARKRFRGLTAVVCLWLVAGAWMAQAEILQTFYIPLPEDQLAVPLDSISGEGPFGEIRTVISISASANGTLIYYDHWEDGYEADLENPVQASTEIWGDNNPTNGSPPGLATDVVNAGDIIHPENDVPLPRNPATVRYDGRDKMGTSKPLAVTRAAWNPGIGTVLAGAVEVTPLVDFGTAFETPVGEDMSDNQVFQYVGLLVMASASNTSVQIDIDGNGSTDVNTTLNEGEGYVVDGNVDAGATVAASAPVQVHLMTGDVGARFETRWFSLYPATQWSDSYYSPVGTTTASDPAHVYLYNPSGTNVTVQYETQAGTGSVSVPAGGNYKYQMPMDSGAHFYTTNSATFYALSTIDSDGSDNSAHDWGFSLVSERYLTAVALIGWGPGADSNGNQNGSPVWVTAVKPTTVYVDFDGDPATGPLVDPHGQRYDESHTVAAFESLRLYDHSDNDQTGMRVYTADRTFITAAWGQDPSTASPGNPYLDLGTTVPPLPVFSGEKTGELGTDNDSNGLVDPGDVILYTLVVNNDGIIAFGTVTVKDTPSENVTYVAGSTTMDGAPVADDASGTPFPLDDPGLNIGGMQPGDSHTFQYEMTVNAFPPIFNIVVNDAAIILDSEQNVIFVEEQTMVNTPELTSCSVTFTDAGSVPVASYLEDATMYVEVDDNDQNDNASSVETVQVTILNSATGDREALTLTETGNDTGLFRGSLPSSTTAGQAVDDGMLYAVAGNSPHVNFADPFWTSDICSDTVSMTLDSEIKSLYLSSPGQDMDRIDPVASGDATTATGQELGLSSGDATLAVDASSSGTSTSDEITVSHTTSGENRLMLVSVATAGSSYDADVTGITYNGDALTRLGSTLSSANQVALEYWYLVAPAAGTHDCVVSLGASATAGAVVGVTTFTGADQYVPFAPGATGGGIGTSDAKSYTAGTGSIIWDAVAVNGSGATLSASAGQTERHDAKTGVTQGGSSTRPGTSSGSMTWSFGTSVPFQHYAVPIIPAATDGLWLFSDSGTRPRYKRWYGIFSRNDSSSLEMGSPWRIMAGDACPTRDEQLFAGIDGNGTINAEMYTTNPVSWVAATINPLGSVSQSYWWGVDIAYEQSSGDALIVWNDNPNLKYSVWNGASWSTPAIITTPISGEAKQIKMAAKPGSDEIVVVVGSTGGDYALVWNGSSWGNSISLDVNPGNTDFTDVYVAYEQSSGQALVVFGDITGDSNEWAVSYATWNGSAWSSISRFQPSPTIAVSKRAKFITLGSDPGSDRVALGVLTGDLNGSVPADVWLGMWNGSSWDTPFLAVDDTFGSGDRISPNVAVAFESTTGQALATYGKNGLNYVYYRTWSSGAGWSGESTGINLGNNSNSMMLEPDPHSDKIMLTAQDDGSDISYDLWTGTTWGDSSQFELTSGETKNQPFVYVWNQHEAPPLAGEPTTTFTQTLSMATDFFMPVGGTVTVTHHINVTSGSMPANPTITATLKHGATTIITLSNPTYSSGVLTWTGVLGSNVTVPSGQQVTLEITTAQSGVSFEIEYDSNAKPSKVDLPTTTVIAMQALGVYDAPYPGGNLTAQAVNGQTVYVRPSATDPFGPYDITSMDLVIDDPCGGQLSDTLAEAQVVGTNGTVKIYEFAWQTTGCQGAYDITVTAHEGSEGITDTMATQFEVTFDDLGSPASGEFRDAEENTTSTYPAYATVYVRVTDFDENEGSSVADTLQATLTSSSGDSETVTLTETGANTGIFASSIVSGAGAASQGNGALEAPQGDTITLTYTDAENSADTFQVQATINAATTGVALSKTVYRGQDGGASAPGSDALSIITGDGVTFCFEVANTGDTYLNNVTVTDTDISPSVSTNIGLLGPGETVTVFAERSMNSSLTNTAGVVGTPSTGGGVAIGLPNENDSDSAEVVTYDPILDITKTSSPPGTRMPGDTVGYDITVSNIIGLAQTELTVTDLLPAGLTHVPGSTFVIGSGAGGDVTATNAVRDEFETESWANNDGSIDWSDNWTELGESDGPGGGDVRLTDDDGSDRLKIKDKDKGGRGVQRTVDLRASTAATLTFDYRRQKANNATSYVAVEVSTNGTQWTELARIGYPGTDGSYQSASYDLSSHISGQTTVRFVTPANISSDAEIYFDNIEIEFVHNRVEEDAMDAFGSVSYGNNDGSENWSGNWTEINDGGSPAGGQVTIDGGRIRFLQSADTDGLYRSADLSDAFSASLEFDWEVSGLEEELSVYVASSASGPWTLLEAFTGQASSGSRSYDISSYMSGDTTVKFQNNYGTWNVANDIFYADNVRIVWNAEGGGIGTTTGGPPPVLTSGLELDAGESVLVTFTATVDTTISSTQLVNMGCATSSVAVVPHCAYVTNNVDLTTVAGQVRHDTDGDGDLGDADSGMAGVTLELFTDPNADGDPSDGSAVASDVSDASGDYRFNVWPAGSYVVVETDPSGYVSTADSDGGSANWNAINIGAGQDLTGRDFLDAEPATISGYVADDIDGDGDLSDYNLALSGVTVVLFTDPNADGDPGDGTAVATNVTGNTGAFSFADVAPGAYVLVETDPANFTSTADSDGANDNRVALSFVSGVASSGHQFMDTGHSEIHGQVREDADADGNIFDPDSPLAGVTVQLFTDPDGDGDPSDGTEVASDVSHGSGDYSFDTLLPGPYVVVETDPAGYFSTGDVGGGDPNQIALTLLSRTRSSGNDFLDAEQGSISGQVRSDADGDGSLGDPDTGIAGVTIQLFTDPNADGNATDGTLHASTQTDASGFYAFTGTPPGPYVIVEVDPPKFGSTADVDGGDPNRIGMALLSGGNPSDLHFLDAPLGFAILATVVQSSVLDLGEEFTYTISVVNTGQLAQTGVQVKDLLPSNIVYVAGSARATANSGQPFTAMEPPVMLSDYYLPMGESVTITFTARVMSADAVLNQAVVTSVDDPSGISATVSNPVFHLAMTQGVSSANVPTGAVRLGWTVNHDLQGNVKPYDLLYSDQRYVGFSDALSNQWQHLTTMADTHCMDAGGEGRPAPGSLGRSMRFYRAARQHAWRPGQGPRFASKEVYVLKNLQLEEGENWVSLFMIPDESTLGGVFGVDNLPSGDQIHESTRVEWYGATYDGRATNEVWLSSSGHWLDGQGQIADDMALPLHEGFNMVLPPGAGNRDITVLGRVPTEADAAGGHVIPVKGSGAYNVVSYNVPYEVRLADSGLREAGFTGAPAGVLVNPNNSDEIRIFSRGEGSLGSPRARILMNSNGEFTFWTGGSGSAENYRLDVDDALLIYTRASTEDWQWTPSLPYEPPTLNMAP